MYGMLFAESAVLFDFQSVGIVFLVLRFIVITLLAFRAGESNFHSVAVCHKNFTSEKNYTL
jgi:hypothetical protein